VELFRILEQWLWIGATAAEVLVLIGLFRQRLLRSYPFFATFLATDAVGGLILMQFDPSSPAYAHAFRTCTALMAVVRIGVAAELYERICEHFPGIGWFRAGMAAVFILLAALVAASNFRPDLARLGRLPVTVVSEVMRFQGEIFAGAFILTWIFLRLLSIKQPFRPNVVSHWKITTVYFGVSGVTHLLVLATGGSKAVYPFNCLMLAGEFACFLAWFRCLRRSGEQLPAFPRLSLEQVQAVEDYNRELLRAVTSLPAQIAARQAENPDTPVHRAQLP
jgi:hypothetical protein